MTGEVYKGQFKLVRQETKKTTNKSQLSETLRSRLRKHWHCCTLTSKIFIIKPKIRFRRISSTYFFIISIQFSINITKQVIWEKTRNRTIEGWHRKPSKDGLRSLNDWRLLTLLISWPPCSPWSAQWAILSPPAVPPPWRRYWRRCAMACPGPAPDLAKWWIDNNKNLCRIALLKSICCKHYNYRDCEIVLSARCTFHLT